MPFQSQAQMKWMYANHPEMAKKWSEHTDDIKDLPKKKKPSKGKKPKLGMYDYEASGDKKET